MSFPIDIDRVEAVLLHDGWHHVFPRTFDVGTFEFSQVAADADTTLYDGGTAFGFSEETGTGEFQRFAGPISSVLAVRYTRQSDE